MSCHGLVGVVAFKSPIELVIIALWYPLDVVVHACQVSPHIYNIVTDEVMYYNNFVQFESTLSH